MEGKTNMSNRPEFIVTASGKAYGPEYLDLGSIEDVKLLRSIVNESIVLYEALVEAGAINMMCFANEGNIYVEGMFYDAERALGFAEHAKKDELILMLREGAELDDEQQKRADQVFTLVE